LPYQDDALSVCASSKHLQTGRFMDELSRYLARIESVIMESYRAANVHTKATFIDHQGRECDVRTGKPIGSGQAKKGNGYADDYDENDGEEGAGCVLACVLLPASAANETADPQILILRGHEREGDAPTRQLTAVAHRTRGPATVGRRVRADSKGTRNVDHGRVMSQLRVPSRRCRRVSLPGNGGLLSIPRCSIRIDTGEALQQGLRPCRMLCGRCRLLFIGAGQEACQLLAVRRQCLHAP
jgi:hypothetical protein